MDLKKRIQRKLYKLKHTNFITLLDAKGNVSSTNTKKLSKNDDDSKCRKKECLMKFISCNLDI